MRRALLVSASIFAIGSAPMGSQVPEADYFALLRAVMEDTRGRLPVGGVGVDPRMFVMVPTSALKSHPPGLQGLVSELGWRSARFEEMMQCGSQERQGRSGPILVRRCRLVGAESHIMLSEPAIANDTVSVLILMQMNEQRPTDQTMYAETVRYRLVRARQGWRVVERTSLTQT